MTCTFIGHRNTPTDIKPTLTALLIQLIEEQKITRFFIGDKGNFDRLASKILCELSKKYPFITYTVVLSYLPQQKREFLCDPIDNTIYPEGIELVPRKFAIIYRNQWMIDRSDYIITYVTNHFSNAHKFQEYALKKAKTVYNIAPQSIL